MKQPNFSRGPSVLAGLIVVLAWSASIVSANDNSHANDLNDGYAHHDNHSGRYDNTKNYWEWRGPHKGCHIKGKHHHEFHGGHGDPQGALDCSQATINPDSLWPANHKFANVDIVGLAASDSSHPKVTIRCVYQDEPLNGMGDGNTDVDAKISAFGQLKLRKERASRRHGNGNGRVYHVDFEARDDTANESCIGSVAVEVPHRWWGKAKDDGRLYVSLDNGFNCGGDANQSPVITSDPLTTAMELTLYEYTVVAEDPENDTLGYRFIEAPDGMDITSDGVIEWTPEQGAAGNYPITVEVNDGQNSVVQSYVLEVLVRGNTAPIITSMPVLDATEEQLYDYQLTATDNENDTFGFSLVVGPSGLSVSLQGLVQWTPNEGQAGLHTITIEVIDALGAIETQSYTIAVAAKPNNAPEILSTPLSSVDENVLYQYTVLAIDPDGTELTYRLVDAPANAILTNNTVEWAPTFDDAGEYSIEIEVKDAEGESATQGFLLTVIDVNRSPVFTSFPTLIAAENTLYQYLPEAFDDDGDLVVLELSASPEGMVLNTDGIIEWMPGYDAAGSYEIALLASDGRGGVTAESYQLIVSNLNRDPQITSTPIETAIENVVYNYQVEASDDDDQALVFSLIQAPDGMTISDIGLIEWTPKFDASGDVAVELSVTDSESTITQSFVIKVDNINRLPVAVDQVLEIAEDISTTIMLEANDSDADALTYVISLMPIQGTAILTGNQVQYTPPINFVGTDSFTFIVNDGSGDSAPAVVSIAITSVNDAPVISFSPPLTGQENVAYTADVNASDVEGDLLLFSLLTAPMGMTIDGAMGVINWLPSFDQAGDNTVMVAVTDIFGATDTFSFDVAVTNTNRLPVAQPVWVEIFGDTSVLISLLATDLDSDVLTYAVVTGAINGSVIIDANVATYTPNTGFTGGDGFTYVANDGTNDSEPAIVSITVSTPNSPPVIISAAKNVGLVGESYIYSVDANDPDNDDITFALDESPVDMIIDKLSGGVSWASPVAGEHPVRVVVSDSNGASTEQSYILFVSSELPPLTNRGEDFWLTFGPNLTGNFENSYQLFLAAEDVATVTVSIAARSYTNIISLDPDMVTVLDLTDQLPIPTINAQQPEQIAVHVQSDQPISLYTMNTQNGSSDATFVFPKNVLGTDYSVATIGGTENDHGTFFSVVAPENDTLVFVTPSENYIDASGVQRIRGQSFEVLFARCLILR